jgi:hypothetical protein
MQRHHDQLADLASRNRCELVLCDTSRPLGELFVDYLNRRSLLNRGR